MSAGGAYSAPQTPSCFQGGRFVAGGTEGMEGLGEGKGKGGDICHLRSFYVFVTFTFHDIGVFNKRNSTSLCFK